MKQEFQEKFNTANFLELTNFIFGPRQYKTLVNLVISLSGGMRNAYFSCSFFDGQN